MAGPVVEPPPATIPAPAVIPPPAPEPAAPAPAPAAQAPAPAAPAVLTISQMLGEAEKPQWSPQELVLAAIGLDGVSGAVIGLHEGLLVAAELPDHLKGDTISAFLPQMFARLNNYTGEMKLGSVDELLFTTQDAHFQAYKVGEVYFAVLGKPGEALPWENMRVIADQLGRQNSK
jgi:predicted regulator of Ras-like GTPase activity (Roadblock/LC7/MglB family)